MSKNATGKYNLSVSNPNLAKEWHPVRNGNLRPDKITPWSNRKVWWLCKKGHEWHAAISNRSHGNGCPYCSGQAVGKDNSLQAINPNLAKQWHPIKNKNLTPEDVTAKSGKKVWWLCKKGHEWHTTVANRSNGGKCPYCSGKKVCDDNSLQAINPNLAKQWHPIKNKNLTPEDVTAKSGKKVWWLCKKGHEWHARIADRTSGTNCPYCSGKKVCDDNSLQAINPDLAKEWHPSRNGTLTSSDVMPSTARKVWWLCKKGHEWQATINHRANNRGCPYCSGQAVGKDNSLQAINPDLAKQWHPIKNKNLTPEDVTAKSGKKVWWLCKKGHEWHASIASRSNGTGCPSCHSQTSLLELRVYTEFMYIFNSVQHRKKIYGVECDVYLPNLKTGIEIDGAYWHKNKYSIDKRKTKLLESKGIFLLRLREKGLEKISEHDVTFSSKNSDLETIKKIVSVILKKVDISNDIQERIEVYLKNKVLVNEKVFIELLDILPGPLPGNSLLDKNKAVASEWHPTKNGALTSNGVSISSGKKVWWLCKKGHEWQASIDARSNGTRCPYCSGKKVCDDNSLQTINPDLAKEWHPVKNGNLGPDKVTQMSHRKIWWICKKGHEWHAAISNRSHGNGCPYCSGQAVGKDNCLQTINPELAKEWHLVKNGNLGPDKVTQMSHRKIWWICKNGHEWQASIADRSNGTRCPYCSGKKVCDDNSLQTINPDLAKEWHPIKNKNLTPEDVTAKSGKKVWWLCKKGHEWKTKVAARSNGTRCPYCSGKKVCDDNSLQTINPDLAKEWHPVKNGNLGPDKVTQMSNRKIWWICKKGHEWRTTVSHRSHGTGCPYCSGRKLTDSHNLAVINPLLAKEWHPVKNKNLTPKDVTAKSGKKVWWLCKKGHEWQAKIANRTSGTSCPYCNRRTKGAQKVPIFATALNNE